MFCYPCIERMHATVGATIHTHQEIQCLPYAGFFLRALKYPRCFAIVFYPAMPQRFTVKLQGRPKKTSKVYFAAVNRSEAEGIL